MDNTKEIEQLRDELKVLHISRIRNVEPDLSYFKSMQREVEILKRLKEIEPQDAEERQPHFTFWTSEQITILREGYADSTAEELAAKVGKSVRAIRSKAHLLGIVKYNRQAVEK